MISIDLVDDTFVVAAPASVASRVRDPARWREWWPDLDLHVTRDRGEKGMQWGLTGALLGSAEIWLEPYADGTLVHFYLRAELAPASRPGRGGATPRTAARHRQRRAVAWKRAVHRLKDELEGTRPPGCPRPSGDVPTVKPGTVDAD